MPILSLQSVTKKYAGDGQPVTALDEVSLEISAGEFIALVGRSGCGKSTLLNLAGAMDFPTSGKVLLGGISTSALGDAQLTALRREKVGFEGLGERFPHQLSGGQMQRVAIARALIHAPNILLADEPTGNLDNATGQMILSLLHRLTREENTATIIATHSLEAAALADTVVRLRDGKIEDIARR